MAWVVPFAFEVFPLLHMALPEPLLLDRGNPARLPHGPVGKSQGRAFSPPSHYGREAALNEG